MNRGGNFLIAAIGIFCLIMVVSFLGCGEEGGDTSTTTSDDAHIKGRNSDGETTTTSNNENDDVGGGDGTFYLSFPLEKKVSITSVFDHSMNAKFCADGNIVAYNGEKATDLSKKDTSCETHIDENKYSYLPKPMSIPNYISTRLSYDGHPGYDYRTKDISLNGIANVLATADGNVTYVDKKYWGRLDIEHKDGYKTIYSHLSEIYNSLGDHVDRGKIIGKSGYTGLKSKDDTHLHFAVHKLVNGIYVPVDPYGWKKACGDDPYKSAENIDLWGGLGCLPKGSGTSKLPDTGQTVSYTTTFGEDHDYSINPPSYKDNGNETVTDNLTGLVWQKRDDNKTRTWADAGAYCDDLSLGGQTDWRLPTKKELVSIVNYGTYNPSINTAAFPDTEGYFYWSSTTAFNPSLAWFVYFGEGNTSTFDKSLYSGYVRCVRGQISTPSFVDNGNGTVTDNITGLMWQQEDDDDGRTWEQALSYCEGLSLGGYSDWRLPNIKELGSIIDETAFNPAINTNFTNTNMYSSEYRSSTTFANNSSNAWAVEFVSGDIINVDGKGISAFYARCVR